MHQAKPPFNQSLEKYKCESIKDVGYGSMMLEKFTKFWHQVSPSYIRSFEQVNRVTSLTGRSHCAFRCNSIDYLGNPKSSGRSTYELNSQNNLQDNGYLQISYIVLYCFGSYPIVMGVVPSLMGNVCVYVVCM